MESIIKVDEGPPSRDPWDSLSWWRPGEEQARRIERQHNEQHPNNQIRIEVVDTLATSETIDSIFNYGLLIIPSLFLVSATLWCLSRFLLRTAVSLYLSYAALVLAGIACVAFVVFGLIFLIGMCSGYRFEYHSVDEMVNNPALNYTVVALPAIQSADKNSTPLPSKPSPPAVETPLPSNPSPPAVETPLPSKPSPPPTVETPKD